MKIFTKALIVTVLLVFSNSILFAQNPTDKTPNQSILYNKLTPYEYSPELPVQNTFSVDNPASEIANDELNQTVQKINPNKPTRPKRSYYKQPEMPNGSKAYCIPMGSTDWEYISNVTAGTINNTTGNNAYEDWTSLVTDMNQGSNYTVSLTIGNWWESDISVVWIDWDQDEVFDDNISTERYDCSFGSEVQTTSITVPLDALLGQTRMRVRLRDGSFGEPLDPCDTTAYGEVEDYTINVLEVTSTPELSMSPSSPFDYGNIGMGEVITEVFAFTNTGAGTINITDISLDVSSDPEFSILSTYGVPGDLPLDSISVEVQFAPLTEGTFTAILNVTEDLSKGISTFNLAGNGVIRPSNNECVNALLLPETYPQTVNGSTIYATGDPDCIIDPTVWYELVLPFHCNKVVLDFCPTPANLGTDIASIVAFYFDDCTCWSSHPHSILDFNTCITGLAPYIEYWNIPGPATILIPVSISDASNNFELDFEFDLDVTDCTPTVPGCGNTFLEILTPTTSWQLADYLSGDTYYWEFDAIGGYNYAFSNCGSGEDTKLRVYDHYFDEVASGDDFGPYCSGSEASLDWLCPLDGTYYISIANADNFPVSCEDLLISYHLAYKYTTCGAPNNLYTDNITVSSATINWANNSTATLFNIEWGEPGFTPGTGMETGSATVTVNNPPYSYDITGLSEGTSYDCYVQAECTPEEPSSWAGPELFSTLNINDDCANAAPINEVYEMVYSTLSATFDGPGSCVTSPNIWYDFTATQDGDLVITTNGSSYDTKLTLYDSFDCATMIELGCDDDGGAGTNSVIRILGVTAEEEFKIEVGGSFSNKGNGLLTVEVFNCPSGSIAESETCGENTNGGCIMDPSTFEQINVDDIICGTLWAENGQRDMDWFELTIAGYATITMNVYGTGPIVFGPAEQYQPGCSGCEYITGYIEPATTIEVLEHGSITTEPLPPGTYYFIVQPNLFSGYPCDTLKYIAEWTMNTYTPNPGEFCSTAITAGLGLNNAIQQPVWYKYAGTGDTIQVTSCLSGQTINTDLYVYDGCCGNLIIANDDDPECGDNLTASTVEFLTETGVTYYLHWDDTYSSEAFSFNITITSTSPEIDVNPLSFQKYLQQDEIISDLLSVGNPGAPGSLLNFDATASETWLTLNGGSTYLGSLNSGETDDITVGFDMTGLSPGIYLANITINSNDPDNPQLIIPVEVNVGIFVDITVILEGPYNLLNGTMTTTLKDNNYLPLEQPYSPTLPYYNNLSPVWLYSGIENVSVIPDNVADWVVVQLRDSDTPGNAGPGTILNNGSQAVFLLNDGSVVSRDGSGNLFFFVSYSQNLYAVIYHRNHLGIMSNFPLTETGGIYSYNFSMGPDQAYGTDAQKNLGNGVYAMPGGDANADGIINSIDITNAWYLEAGLSDYMGSDINLNGHSNNEDKNDIWFWNYGSESQIPE